MIITYKYILNKYIHYLSKGYKQALSNSREEDILTKLFKNIDRNICLK